MSEAHIRHYLVAAAKMHSRAHLIIHKQFQMLKKEGLWVSAVHVSAITFSVNAMLCYCKI